MLGLPRLLTFAFRSLVLLLAVSILWIGAAAHYNEAVVQTAKSLAPSEAPLTAVGAHFAVGAPDTARTSMDGLTLHFGLVLMGVLVLAAVGLGLRERLLWLLAVGAVAFGLHVAGVALFAWGVRWAGTSDLAVRLVSSLFAVFWALLPAVLGGAWCILYWVPRASAEALNRSEVNACNSRA